MVLVGQELKIQIKKIYEVFHIKDKAILKEIIDVEHAWDLTRRCLVCVMGS